MYHFWQKGTPFVYLLLTKGTPFYPFHIRSLELCILSTAVNAIFKIWINQKTRTLSRLFLSHKMHLLAFLSIFTDRKEKFLYLFICFNKWNRLCGPCQSSKQDKKIDTTIWMKAITFNLKLNRRKFWNYTIRWIIWRIQPQGIRVGS